MTQTFKFMGFYGEPFNSYNKLSNAVKDLGNETKT